MRSKWLLRWHSRPLFWFLPGWLSLRKWTNDVWGSLPRSYRYHQRMWTLSISLAHFLCLFKWIFHIVDFVHESLKLSNICHISAVERLCLKLLRHIFTSSCWVNFYVHSKVSPLYLAMKSIVLSFFFYFVSISSGTPVGLLLCRTIRETSATLFAS